MGTADNPTSPAWSYTRDRMLRSCPRRYYYHYHLAAAGARPGAPPRARGAYVLKHLTTLDLVLGLAIHAVARALAAAVRAGRPLPPNDAPHDAVRSALNGAYRSSRNAAAFLRSPARSLMLREIYYEGGLAPEAIERIRDKASLCLDGLRQSPLWETLAGLPRHHIRIIDTPVRFRVRDTDVWAAPDLVYQTPSSENVVVDWKSGRANPDAEIRQVGVYGLLLSNERSPEPQDARAMVIHLGSDTVAEYDLDEDRLAAAEEQVLAGAREMREGQAAVDRLGTAAITAFPLTSRRAQCSRCNFFELCEAELRRTSHAGADSVPACAG